MSGLMICRHHQYAAGAVPGTGSGGSGPSSQPTVAITMTASKSGGTYEKGNSLSNVTFTIVVTPINPTDYPVSSVKLYRDGTVIQTFTPSSSKQTYTYTASSIDTTTTFKAEAKTSADTAVSSIKYTFVYPMFYGSCDTTPSAAEILAMQKKISGKGTTKCQFSSVTRVAFCYPKEYGNLTSILDDMNFEYIYAFEKTEETLSIDGSNITYNVYTTIDEAMITNFNYTFKF